MRFVAPSVTLLAITADAELVIEAAARTCYRSEGRICPGSARELIAKLIALGHECPLEQANASFRIICDRGVSHELVRHRLASFCQESTRYCDYAGQGISVVVPPELRDNPHLHNAIIMAEECYEALRRDGVPAQYARAVLPTCLKTELVVAANFREWRHIIRLRCAPTAHPQMRPLIQRIGFLLLDLAPSVFADLRPLLIPGHVRDLPPSSGEAT